MSIYDITHLTAGGIFVILCLAVDKGPTTHQFGCDLKENTDTRLVFAFPTSPVLAPELAVGQPGQVARFEFTKRTKKNKTQHGRRADVIFVA